MITVMPAQNEMNDMPTSFEEYFGLKMLYKELRQELKALEMFPEQMGEE